jgi:hypothetical protein
MLLNNLQMKTQFVTDNQDKKPALLVPIKDYQKMIDKLEELEDIRPYDEAKNEDDGKRMLFTDYLKSEGRSMAKYTLP